MPKEQKPKLTDEQRHARFVEMAREVEASEDPEDFERAFRKTVHPGPTHPQPDAGPPRPRKGQ
jgi:hypothetical protein